MNINRFLKLLIIYMLNYIRYDFGRGHHRADIQLKDMVPHVSWFSVVDRFKFNAFNKYFFTGIHARDITCIYIVITIAPGAAPDYS